MIKRLYLYIFKIFWIRIKGVGNTILFSDNTTFGKDSKIKINGDNNIIQFGNGKFKNIQIGIDGNNHKIIIGDTTRIQGLKVVIQNRNNKVIIGNNVGANNVLLVSCGINNFITVGDNCMFSTNVEIWGCDGHSILHNGEIINKSRPVIIGNNVWIGSGVKILKGTNIKNNCVVGAGSLLTNKEFSCNSLIVGNPAKVVKENISWSVENLEK